MRRIFKPPTPHYDEKVQAIDEEICRLIVERKERSNYNPGFPKQELITKWSQKYQLYEEFLDSLFHQLFNEYYYKPRVEPKRFVKNIPLLKTFEEDETFYSVTFIRQFENASVVHLIIDRTDFDPETHTHGDFPHFELSIEHCEINYECHNHQGSGSGDHYSFSFIASPPLPDSMEDIQLTFTEFKNDQPTGFKVVL